MTSLAVRHYLNGGLRLLVGGAFVFAGVLKILDPAKFAQDVSNYRLVPHELINLVAILVPWIEVTAGSFVLAGIWLRAAALVITSLTVMFFSIIVSALARGLNIECGCFGTIGGRHIGLVNLAIDTALLFLAALLARRSKDGPPNESSKVADGRNSGPLTEASAGRSQSSNTSSPGTRNRDRVSATILLLCACTLLAASCQSAGVIRGQQRKTGIALQDLPVKIIARDLPGLKSMIEKDRNLLHGVDGQGNSLLHWAALCSYPDAVVIEITDQSLRTNRLVSLCLREESPRGFFQSAPLP